MPRRRLPCAGCAFLCFLLFIILFGASAFAAGPWASLPERRPAPLLLETLVTDNPPLQLDGPLSQAVKALADGHAVLRAGGDRKAALLVLLASSGKGKTRFLYELKKQLQQENGTMCIPITFNGRQSLEQDSLTVKSLTKEPEERAIVHVALRLLHSTFQIDDLGSFATDFCKTLARERTELSTDFLADVLVQCAVTGDDIKNVTILVDESGRLPKLLEMPRGDADEFSALRSLCGPSTVNSLGFSVMLLQAGLGDFAEQTVSSRDVKVIVLQEQEIEEALNEWVLHTADSKGMVQAWATSVAAACQEDLKASANVELYKELVLKPLVVEYAPLARALEYLTEEVKRMQVSATDNITTLPKLGSTIRRIGQELRNSVDAKLNTRYSIVAQRLSPAVLAPAILPSGCLKVSLEQEIGRHRVSKLLSEAAYANALEQLQGDAEFVPKIVPAFLRQAAYKQLDLRHLRAFWEELEAVLLAQASGTADAGKLLKLLDVGVRLWSYTILLALSEFEATSKLTLADIFPACVAHRGLEMQNYKLQVPTSVTLKTLQQPLNESKNILQFAIKGARQGRATVLGLAGLADGQGGADSLAVLPLEDKEVLLLGLEPHGGDSTGADSVFWQALPDELRNAVSNDSNDVQLAMLYITHDQLVDKTQVLDVKWDSTVQRDRVNLMLMDRSGLASFLGPLWPLYAQARYMRS